MTNRELVETLLGTLTQYVGELRAEQGVTFEAFQHDLRTRRYVEHTLQLAIQACLDIAALLAHPAQDGSIPQPGGPPIYESGPRPGIRNPDPGRGRLRTVRVGHRLLACQAAGAIRRDQFARGGDR